MRYEQIRKFWDRAAAGGRKSFRLDELDSGWFMELQNGYFIPYLDFIQKDLDCRIDRAVENPYNDKSILACSTVK